MDKSKAADQFVKLLDIVEKLRGPNGCPWDKEQTHESLLPYFLEEAYEVIESIEEKNWDNLNEELGDVKQFEIDAATEFMWALAAVIGCFSMVLVPSFTIYFAARAKEKKLELKLEQAKIDLESE